MEEICQLFHVCIDPLVDCLQHGGLDHLQRCRHLCILENVHSLYFLIGMQTVPSDHQHSQTIMSISWEFCRNRDALSDVSSLLIPCASFDRQCTILVDSTISTLVDRFKSW